MPTAWNWTVACADGTEVMIAGHAVSITVGAAVAVEVEVDTTVGGGGVPGQSEIACKNAPAGDAVPQTVTGTPPGYVGHGTDEPPPLPQFHENATAIRTIAAPITIHRARSIIENQL
jgi:hypothetical protein